MTAARAPHLPGFVLLCVFSIGVAIYAIAAYGFLAPGALVHPEMRASFEAHRLALYAHVFGAAAALVLAWRCWVPNLAPAELLLARRPAVPARQTT